MKDMLDDIFFEVLDCVLSQIDGEKSNFSFCYDNHGYVIEGYGRVEGVWARSGDGYFEPIEYHLRGGRGSLTEFTVCYCDGILGEVVEYSEDVVVAYKEKLERYLESYMNDCL